MIRKINGKTIGQIAKEYGINRGTLYARFKKNPHIPYEKLVDMTHQCKVYSGNKTIKQLSVELGLGYSLLYSRIQRNPNITQEELCAKKYSSRNNDGHYVCKKCGWIAPTISDNKCIPCSKNYQREYYNNVTKLKRLGKNDEY